MKRLLPLPILFLLCSLSAQDSDLPLQHDLYHFVDRLDIRAYTEEVIHTDLKPFGRDYLAHVLDRSFVSEMSYTERLWYDRARFQLDDSYAADSLGKGIFRYFYRNGRDFYQVNEARFRLFVNPAFRFQLGAEQHQYTGEGLRQNLFTNSRGLVLRGTLFDKLGFYSEIYDNQLRHQQYVQNRYDDVRNLYGETSVKENVPQSIFDYFHSSAYLTYKPWEGMRIKFGHDKAFLGQGFQSLLFSDYAANQLMLQLQTRIWKLEYTNYFAQLIDFIPNKPDVLGTHPRKYLAMHYLSYKPAHWLSLGVFESVIYGSQLPTGERGFELQYLNPIIFYRSVEQSLGSPDNSILGFSGKINLWRRAQLYGQLLIDDLNVSQLRQNSSYWGTKLGLQAGVKALDLFGVETLDLQAEYNRIRPHVYQHFNSSTNYTHFGQFLGHSNGANLQDVTMILRYHPFPSWNVYMRFSQMLQGLDEGGLNYGGDVRVSDQFHRASDFPQLGQGFALQVTQLYGRLSYQLGDTDIYLEAEGRYRVENGIRSLQMLGGLRGNLATNEVRF